MRTLRAIFFLAKLTLGVEALGLFHRGFKAQERESQKESCANFATVPIPPYRLVRQWRTDLKPMPVVFVSVKPNDVSRDSMIALGCRIGGKYSSEHSLDVYILDNRKAAKIYSPAQEGNSGKTEKSLRALYEFSRENDHQWLDWRPDPNRPSKWVRIDLGKAPLALKP